MLIHWLIGFTSAQLDAFLACFTLTLAGLFTLITYQFPVWALLLYRRPLVGTPASLTGLSTQAITLLGDQPFGWAGYRLHHASRWRDFNSHQKLSSANLLSVSQSYNYLIFHVFGLERTAQSG
jgi:hypothetical protein